ncbi:MAG: tRNA1(Val) (adenine(37)-N6)-methyltransferase [Saccharofermentanales bacterium]
MISLYEDETIEDLQLNGLRMIQMKDGFRFGEDSVLLANFAAGIFGKTSGARRSIIDLGCNCGSIALILSAKLPGSMLTGVEITSRAAEIFKRNIILNGLSGRISCIHKDWNGIREDFCQGGFDCVISNPPYAVFDENSKRDMTDLRIAREEIHSSLDQLLQISAYLLKHNGKAFFIYRANRLADVLESMRKNKIEPRIIRFIQPFLYKAPTAFLVMGQKYGKAGGLKIEPPVILFGSPSHYTDEVLEMYGKYPPLNADELYDGIDTEHGKVVDE